MLFLFMVFPLKDSTDVSVALGKVADLQTDQTVWLTGRLSSENPVVADRVERMANRFYEPKEIEWLSTRLNSIQQNLAAFVSLTFLLLL